MEIKLFKSKKGVMVQNIFGAILSFFISLAMIYGFNTAISTFIGLFEDTVLRIICVVAYLAIVILLMFYVPFSILTSQDPK